MRSTLGWRSKPSPLPNPLKNSPITLPIECFRRKIGTSALQRSRASLTEPHMLHTYRSPHSLTVIVPCAGCHCRLRLLAEVAEQQPVLCYWCRRDQEIAASAEPLAPAWARSRS